MLSILTDIRGASTVSHGCACEVARLLARLAQSLLNVRVRACSTLNSVGEREPGRNRMNWPFELSTAPNNRPLLFRPLEVLNTDHAGIVKALRWAQGERFKHHWVGSIGVLANDKQAFARLLQSLQKHWHSEPYRQFRAHKETS